MKKILASLLAITMLMTTMSACVIPASADEVVATDYIYNEDFEAYSTTGNWLDAVDADNFVTGLGEGKETAWSIYGADGLYTTENDVKTANGVVQVVSDSTIGNGKFLKIDVNNVAGTYGNSWIHVKANANGKDGIARADMEEGKKLVLSADVYLPSTRADAYESPIMRYISTYTQDDLNNGNISVGSNINGAKNIYAIMNGTGWGYYGFTRKAYGIGGDWVTIKRIIDVSAPTSAERPADTTRFIHDGAVMTVAVGTEGISKSLDINEKFKYAQGTEIIDTWQTAFTGDDLTSTVSDFNGVVFGNAQDNKSSTTTEYYIDNVKAYWIDAFKQEGTITYEKVDANGNWYDGAITIPFNREIAETVTTNGVTAKTWALTDLLYLVDAEGNDVTGGIASAELSADKKSVVIELASTIDRDVAYTIEADARFSDVELQGLSVTGEASERTELATFTAGVDPYAHIYFDEDFEDYKVDGTNWAENLTNGYVTAAGVEENAWRIGSNATAQIPNGIVRITKDPKATAEDAGRGNVLEINNGTIAAGKNIAVLKTANGTSPITRSSLAGKRVVIEGDIYIPADNAADEETVFAYYGDSNINRSRPNNYISPYNSKYPSSNATKPNGSLYVIGGGNYNNVLGTRTVYNGGGEWHTYRYVIDVADEITATHLDTTRAYIDGVLVAGVTRAESATEPTLINEYPIYEDDGTTYRAIVDHWKRAVDFSNQTNFSAGDFYGIFMGTRTTASGGETNQAYYVDNMTAYYVDDLKLTTPDLTNFTGGGINLTFNQKIANTNNFNVFNSAKTTLNTTATEYTLKDMFTILDKDGNDIDGIKSATVSADGKTVTIVPQNIESNSDYTLVISRYFRDAEGQGLTKNSTEYEIEMHVGEFVPFALKNISQTEISGFTQGRDAKVTAEFSMNISDDMLTNGIVVTNSEGETVARNSGWTATIDAENAKVVVFDFSNLPIDSYEVTTNDNFAIAGEVLSNTLSITITAASQPIVLFEETFDKSTDTYVVGENWIKAGNVTTDISKSNMISYSVNSHDWNIQTHWSAGVPTSDADIYSDTKDFVGVVAAPVTSTTMSGNVLKISNSRGTGYNANYVALRRNFNKLNGIDFTSEEYAGKKLVYEADVYTGAGQGDTPFMDTNRTGKDTIFDYSDWQITLQNNRFRSAGTYKSAFKTYGPVSMYPQVYGTDYTSTAPVKMKFVLTKGENLDTLAIYSNGKLIQRTEAQRSVLKGHEYNTSAGHEFVVGTGDKLKVNDTIYGIFFSAAGRSSTEACYYVDNVKAYLVDEFVVENVSGAGDVFNTAKATVDFTFSKAVDATTVDGNVVLLDATGAEVAGGIEATTLSDGDYKLSVKLAETLPGKANYTVKLTEGLRDTDGLTLSTAWKYYKYPIDDYYEGTDNVYSITDIAETATLDCTYTPATATDPAYLAYGNHKVAVDMWVRDIDAMKTEVSLTTSKATSLFAEATATNADGVVTVNATFTNPETTDMPVWAVVAVYGEYNEMLGCTIANVATVGAGSTASDAITVNVADSSKVKTVKLHVWDSYEDMVPYHRAETLMGE